LSQRPSRRGFLTAVAAAAGGAVALPVICSSPAFAGSSGELPVVNRPDHPAAQYPAGLAATAYAEPLNASVDCGLHGRGA
jgi:hypothetical protein